MLPGPVSNANTSCGRAPAGITVTFAMPPIFSATRPRACIAIEQVIDERHQRRALPSRGHVRGTEIANRGDAGALGDHARLADLQCGGDPPRPPRALRRALMVNRLAVRADQRDLPHRTTRHFLHAAIAARANSSPSRKFSWLISAVVVAERRSAMRRIAFAHRRGEPHVMMPFELRRKSRRRARYPHERHVDPVRRRAGHHSHDGIPRSACSKSACPSPAWLSTSSSFQLFLQRREQIQRLERRQLVQIRRRAAIRAPIRRSP